MKKIILLLAILSVCFTGCKKEVTEEEVKKIIELPVETPVEMQTAQSYLVDNERFRRVRMEGGEFLLAFYGRLEGETADKNRIIYINKDSEIVKEFNIPVEADYSIQDFYFDRNIVVMINKQYSGVDSDGNMHGIAIFDTDGNLIANYEPRDPYTLKNVDKFTQLNRTTGNYWNTMWSGYKGFELVFSTPFAIYKYNLTDKSLDEWIGLEKVIPDFDFDNMFADVEYADLLTNQYGFNYFFIGEKYGLIFAVNDHLEKNSARNASGIRFTLYTEPIDGVIPFTEKDACEGVVLGSYDGNRLIYTDPSDKSFIVNKVKHPEYNYSVYFYNANYYALNHNFEPFVAGWLTTPSHILLAYYNNLNNLYYNIGIPASDAVNGDAVYNHPFTACGQYVYFDSDDVHNGNISYRFDFSTGDGDFVYGSVESLPFCPGYRLYEEQSTEDDSMKKIQIFQDCILQSDYLTEKES